MWIPTNIPGAVSARRAACCSATRPALARRRRPRRASRWPSPAGNSVTDFDPNLQSRLRAELGHRHPARIDPRHGAGSPLRRQPRHRLWRQVNINEINIFEQRLPERVPDRAGEPGDGARLRRTDPVCMAANRTRSNKYFGLAGQRPLPMIVTALAANNDATTRAADRAGTGRRAGQRDRHQRHAHDPPDRRRLSDQPVPGESDARSPARRTSKSTAATPTTTVCRWN